MLRNRSVTPMPNLGISVTGMRGVAGGQDKRPASYAAVCGLFSDGYAYGTQPQCQLSPNFGFSSNGLSYGCLKMRGI